MCGARKRGVLSLLLLLFQEHCKAGQEYSVTYVEKPATPEIPPATPEIPPAAAPEAVATPLTEEPAAASNSDADKVVTEPAGASETEKSGDTAHLRTEV